MKSLMNILGFAACVALRGPDTDNTGGASTKADAKPDAKAAKKAATEDAKSKAAAAKKEKEEATVKVRVIQNQPLFENGAVYNPPKIGPRGQVLEPGDEFETSSERAAALAKHDRVEILDVED